MSATEELLAANQRLLSAIVAGDWKTYAELCADDLTCFEPEAHGHLVQGLPFHKFYFDLNAGGGASSPINVTMATPHVRLCGDVGIVSYMRLTQRLDLAGEPVTSRVEETRVWQRSDAKGSGGAWRHVHFHRSPPG